MSGLGVTIRVLVIIMLVLGIFLMTIYVVTGQGNKEEGLRIV